MVEHLNLKELARLDKHSGDVYILWTGLATRRRVVVRDDDSRAIELKGQTKQFADSDYDVTLYFATSSANVAEMLPPGAGSQVGHALSRPRRARLPHTQHHLRGLDSVWPVKSNPHRESGTRFGLRQTLDRQARCLFTIGRGVTRGPFGRLRWSRIFKACECSRQV